MAQLSGTPAKWARVLGVSAAGGGGVTVAWLTHPDVSVWVIGALVIMIMVIVGTALYASQTVSDRAFRLLCLIWNRPEPARQRSRKRRSIGGQAQSRQSQHPRPARLGSPVAGRPQRARAARKGDKE